LDKTPKYDITLIIGDFNAQIGKQDSNEGVIGIHTIHEKSNNNGDLLAIRRNLMIKTPFFRTNEFTWEHGRAQTATQ